MGTFTLGSVYPVDNTSRPTLIVQYPAEGEEKLEKEVAEKGVVIDLTI
jgi:hypothetical protein